LCFWQEITGLISINILHFLGIEDSGKEPAIRNFKLPIKEKFSKSNDILGCTELILYSNWVSKQNKGSIL
jgi:hypothetical protein